MRKSVGTAVIAVLWMLYFVFLILILTLSGCATTAPTGTDEPEQSGSAQLAQSGPQSAQPQAQDETTSQTAASTVGFTLAPWAADFAVSGTPLKSVDLGLLRVDMFYSGTAPSPVDGQWFGEREDDLLINAGDPLALLTFVVTNQGGTTVLTEELVEVFLVYEEHPHYGGMEQIKDADFFSAHQMPVSTISAGEPPFVLAPNESFAFATSILHQSDETLEVTLFYVPVNEEEGTVEHGNRVTTTYTVQLP